jgi:hypothetical protein
MNAHTNLGRWMTTGLLAATTLTLASPALAGHGRRYKGVSHSSPVQRVVIRERSGDAGPALAGLIGGFILGAALTSNAHPVVVHERVYRRPVVVYRYYDPYEDVWFDSLDECEFSSYRRHPRIVQVIEVRSGRHVRTLRYRDGEWHRWDDDRERRWRED